MDRWSCLNSDGDMHQFLIFIKTVASLGLIIEIRVIAAICAARQVHSK